MKKEYKKNETRTKTKQYWGRLHPEENKMAQREYKMRCRKTVFDHYGRKCNCCGEINEKFLTIDHVNNDGNLDKTPSGKKITGSDLCLKIIRENFPDTYQILCYNCNCGKRVNNGSCPHNDK